MKLQRIVPCLWFDEQAEEAARFYASIFPNSTVGTVTRYGESASKAAHRPAGSVMTVGFELDGQKFLGLNGGPIFPFTEAVSFMVYCDSQEELDRYWTALSAGGQEGVCGWLKDRYGLSWQIVPALMEKMTSEGSPDQLERVMSEVMQMKKLDIATLERAYGG
jgi:predicted 3-demethylubiquinone-9 3-methyltransferase (glyoxalase superfamily)